MSTQRLRLVTFNIAHGRGLTPIQGLTSSRKLRLNLRRIAGLLGKLEADLVAIAGEAGSHCLANTVRDIARNFGNTSYIKRLVLLEDATSPVPGFERFQSDFVKEMTAQGMQISTTRDFLA